MNKNITTKTVLVVIAVIVIGLLIFKAGQFVGYKKAGFSGRMGDNYSRTFGGPMMREGMPGGHGVTGKVIKVSPDSIVIEGSDSVEKVITVSTTTLVRNLREDAHVSDIKVNDMIVVIGTPSQNGEVTAKLIRIIPQK